MREVIAHEVFHCFEAVMAGDDANWNRKPDPSWLIEGAAEWAGAELAGGKAPVAGEERAVYYEHPARPLFSRSYDAIGFFDHMQSVGISPWSKFKAMFAQENDESAYFGAVADDRDFLTTEASVFLREASGWPWAPRPATAPSGGMRYRPRTIAVGGSGHPPVDITASTPTASITSCSARCRKTSQCSNCACARATRASARATATTSIRSSPPRSGCAPCTMAATAPATTNTLRSSATETSRSRARYSALRWN